MAVKTKNRTTISTTRLSTSTEIFHCKKMAATKNKTSRTPRTGKIYKMLNRSAGVEGRGALLRYSISVSSCSIEKPFSIVIREDTHSCYLYFKDTRIKQSQRARRRTRQATSGSYYS